MTLCISWHTCWRRSFKNFCSFSRHFLTSLNFLFKNPQAAAAEAADLPPKYDIVMGFDIPPPAYDTLMIDNEKIQYEIEKCPKESTIQHI